MEVTCKHKTLLALLAPNYKTSSALSRLQSLRPPTHSKQMIGSVEKKLEIARVDEQDKVPFITHYLEGPVDVWWDSRFIDRKSVV